ncbi:DinB family protein, partial [Nocardioides hankookensis]
RPSLDEVLAVGAERMAVVGQQIAELTAARLAATTEPVPGAAYPPTDSYAVRRCLGAILNEEWEHRRFAERDLAILEAGLSER